MNNISLFGVYVYQSILIDCEHHSTSLILGERHSCRSAADCQSVNCIITLHNTDTIGHYALDVEHISSENSIAITFEKSTTMFTYSGKS